MTLSYPLCFLSLSQHIIYITNIYTTRQNTTRQTKQVSHDMAMQRYLGDDIRDHMRRTITTTNHPQAPPEYPLEQLSPPDAHGSGKYASMHETVNGNGGIYSTSSSASTSDDKFHHIDTSSSSHNIARVQSSLYHHTTHTDNGHIALARVRSSFNGSMGNAPPLRSIEDYISPRTGMY